MWTAARAHVVVALAAAASVAFFFFFLPTSFTECSARQNICDTWQTYGFPPFSSAVSCFLPSFKPLPSTTRTLGNLVAEYPTNGYRQSSVCLRGVRRIPFAKNTSRQRHCRVFLGLCRVFRALGKDVDSSSVLWSNI